MRVKFLKQATADYVDAKQPESTDKTFYAHQIVEVNHIEETVRGFIDLIFEDGSAAIGIPKQSLTILK